MRQQEERIIEPALAGRAVELLLAAGLSSRREAERLLDTGCRSLAADGSSRRFWRLGSLGEGWLLIAPGGQSQAELAESRAAWRIGRHLRAREVPLPELFACDEESGLLLVEDLGDVRLHDIVAAEAAGKSHPAGEAKSCYRAALKGLAVMQRAGALGFDPTWCWDTPRYDLAVMVEKESTYFLRAFWQGLLGREVPLGVVEEMRAIAGEAARAPAHFFLHRDFQCRNIMVKEGAVRFIDYQGGRLGPLGYDPASLLIDPYAALAEERQEELLAAYIGEIAKAAGENSGQSEEAFRRHYTFLALQRNLQIVGAFAFLSQIRGKTFFRPFLGPALTALAARLQEEAFRPYPALRALAGSAVAALVAR